MDTTETKGLTETLLRLKKETHELRYRIAGIRGAEEYRLAKAELEARYAEAKLAREALTRMVHTVFGVYPFEMDALLRG